MSASAVESLLEPWFFGAKLIDHPSENACFLYGRMLNCCSKFMKKLNEEWLPPLFIVYALF